MEGLVLFNKPQNYTSVQIVNYFKKLTKKKVGHGGTLDPFAEGLLILGIDDYTKELTKFLKESRKTYIAEIELGAISDTYDITGNIVRTDANPEPRRVQDHEPSSALVHGLTRTDTNLNISEIEKILAGFIGEIEQIPPPYSAIKIKGKRAYKLARKGLKVDLKPRKVKIYNIKILDLKEKILKIEVEVSSGTYIRSLAHDIGQKLGCGAYLKSLVRTKINEFTLEEALSFEDIEKDYLEFYVKVYGRVQRVGFRLFCRNWAQNLGIFGYAKNLTDGSIEVLAQGKEKNLQEFLEKIKRGPILAKVEKIEIIWRKAKNRFSYFETF
ncbi:MAG: hypothetical protein KatS3mg096_471 [Candidatus Parcubacteria bacterium]|nr:MAG: hypothetical protein KatS3mg096_471 [Candidatus Parcubacteria bacterium]